MQITISLLTVGLNIFLGLFTLLKNPKSATHRYFFLLTVLISAWTTTNYFSLNSPTEEQTLFWIRVVMVLVSPIGPVLYAFIRSFPGKTTNIPPKYGIPIVVFTVSTMIIAMTPYMFSSVSIENGNITPTPAPGILAFAIAFPGFIALSFYELFRKFRRAHGIERVQIGYLIFGLVSSFSLMAFSSFIIVMIFRTDDTVFFGPVFSLIFIIFIAFAVVRHRFLDLKALVLRSVFYVLFFAVVCVLYATALVLVMLTFTDIELTVQNVATLAMGALFILAFFRPVERMYQNLVGPIFKKSQYNGEKFINRINELITSTINLRVIIEKFCKEIYHSMGVSKIYLVIIKDRVPVWHYAFRYGHENIDNKTLIRLARKAHHHKNEALLIFEELNESPVKELMRKYDISVVVPLYLKGELIGVMALGEKTSGSIYSSEDIIVLNRIVPQLSIAIRNAFSYEEIQEFNITLKEEVASATEHLKKANKRLRMVDRLKDEFISIASHELRTPMTAIKGYLWLTLHRPPEKLHTDVQKNLEICYSSTERLINLVNDMLTVSRIEGQRIILNNTVFDFREATTGVCAEMAATAYQQKVALTCPYYPHKLMVNADHERLHEVVYNLVGNAVKFTPPGGMVEILLTSDNRNLYLSVRDNGPGIREQDMEKLFTKFGKLDHAYKDRKGATGTGLGLYITKEVLDMYEAEITVESVVDSGSTFTISFPLHTVS